ncbi:hypothetical protein GQ53DRAFT_773336 [Thozetella sp. PMI_491]|nr:hypothetical protein GQ53DRAFT_773336 [Thozetella sp. PMI_491]
METQGSPAESTTALYDAHHGLFVPPHASPSSSYPSPSISCPIFGIDEHGTTPQEVVLKSPKRRRSDDEYFANDGNEKYDSAEDEISDRLDHQEKPRFACPLYKKNPFLHMDCLNLKLTRIRDVKQHIQRRHCPSTFYCPTCYQTFPSMNHRDHHIRARLCQPRSAPLIDELNSVSQEAQGLLKKRATALTPIKQWDQIWEILFKDAPIPSNRYLGSMFEETISMMRDFWKTEGGDIVPDLIQRANSPGKSEEISALLGDLFNEVQVRFEQRVRGHGSVKNSPSPPCDNFLEKPTVSAKSEVKPSVESQAVSDPLEGFASSSYLPSNPPTSPVGTTTTYMSYDDRFSDNDYSDLAQIDFSWFDPSQQEQANLLLGVGFAATESPNDILWTSIIGGGQNHNYHDHAELLP